MATIFGRDPFSFWAPLDTAFLQAMSNFAQYKHLAMFAPFWSSYFHTYLDYATVQTMAPIQISIQATSQMRQAVLAGAFTTTGVAYARMDTPALDVSAPSIPTGITTQTVSDKQINLTWTASPDNVGTAGYVIYRNGQALATSGVTSYSDVNLTDGTQYSYSIAAYDVQGNISAASAPVAAATFDWIAPTAPGTLTAQTINSQQINLTWGAATDNVGVAGYILYAGFSPTSLLPAANVTGTATVRAPLMPNTTYYFAVSAVDAANNVSPRSAVVSATTATLASKWQ